jgi:ribosomal protein S21
MMTGILNKIKEHEYYMSKSEKRREAEKKRIAKLRKLSRKGNGRGFSRGL